MRKRSRNPCFSRGDVSLFYNENPVFSANGEALREASNGKFALTFCNTNGKQGYLPSVEAYAQGGYEARSSHFTPALEEQITNEAKKLIDMI